MVCHDVLVAEGEEPVALVILRSLAAKHIDVVVLAGYSRCVSSFSKYCDRQILAPSMALEKEYVRAVERIVKRIRFNVFFPVFEWSLIPISENRDRISRFVKLPIASHESILTCFDKLSTIRMAINNGVPIPRTYFVESLSKLKDISEQLEYPAVVKPRWSVVWKGDRAFQRRSSYVRSPTELVAAYECINQYFPFPIIQEYVPGTNYSVAALYNEGRSKAFCCIKVSRAWPPSGGNSCYRESVQLEPKMKHYSEILLKSLNWHGIAEVEFRLDSRDNTPKLMEINPRFWGSLSVAVKAGVDFPYLLYRMTMDGDVNSVTNYKVGVKGRYFEQDLMHIASLFKGASTNNVFSNKNRLRTLKSWLRFYEPGIFYDLLDPCDPIPFFLSSARSTLWLVRSFQSGNGALSPPTVRF